MLKYNTVIIIIIIIIIIITSQRNQKVLYAEMANARTE